ncbi:Anaphase-promoting complex, cyclosome, subunit 3 [Gimesia fumaroli]|uniref:Anaphase-promoting complex, cyclosome, subunit 3 n=1 Tax=Gimesia fumaroli TaxID=2527976 RepID=A0A518I699_9PLAN|nr:Anaphase-promoting complex, cyclosome, subunit 3 [Gimesia fumaroli]
MKSTLPSLIRSPKTGLIALLVIFSSLAVARWNQLYFFTPDSARYVMMAKSLVGGAGYRLIDTPGEPLYAHRPPGMSLLLSPAALIAPYNVLLAKATVLLSALALITFLYLFIMRLQDPTSEADPRLSGHFYWPAFLIAFLFAINPYTLFFSTIVMSEIPFMACSLAILYLLAVRQDRASKTDLLLFTGLLVFLPFLRTIGIALVLAVGCWAVLRRQRWPWLTGVACSLLTTGIWMVRNSALEHSGYASVALKELQSQGIVATLLSIIQRCTTHFTSFCQKLFPDMPGSTPRYARMILDENAFLPGPTWIYLAMGALVLVLSCYGMLKHRQQGGTVALLYLIFSLGILSLWPWMQQRFTLPLIPVVLAFIPAGWNAFVRHIEVARPMTQKVSLALFSILLLLFCGWQIRTDASLIGANLKMISQSNQFYTDQLPPNQFSNWNAAGEWIKQHTLPDSRLITRRADIATTGQRYQRLNFFETTNAEKLHQMIEDFSANYLVTFSRDTVSAFPWHLLDQDLVYRMTPVYDEQGVMILKLAPNRTGTIREEYWNADDSLKIARNAIERFPHRLSFQVAFTQQLFEAGHYAELIEYVEKLQGQKIEDVRLTNLLAWSYIKTKRYQKAIREFERAFSMPDQKMLRRDLVQGINLAQETLQASYQPASETQPSGEAIENKDLKLAKTYLRLSHIQKAEQILSETLNKPASYQNHPSELQTLLAKVYLAEGRKMEALAQLNLAFQSGNPEARQLLDMLELEEQVEIFLNNREKNRDEKNRQQTTVILQELATLAQFYEDMGVPGKALSLVERANTCLPNEAQLLKLLLKHQLFYALIPEAEETLLQLRKLTPHDPDLTESAEKIEWLKQTPRF